YLAYASRPGEISLARLNLSTEMFEPLFGFPLAPGADPTQPSVLDLFVPTNLWGDHGGHLFFTNARTVYQVDLAGGGLTAIASVLPEDRNAVGGIWGIGPVLFASDRLGSTILRLDVTEKQVTTIAGQAQVPSVGTPLAGGALTQSLAIPPSSTLY